MDLRSLRDHLLSKPGAGEDRPFTPEIPVFKVAGKMFAYLSVDETPAKITLKLDPLHGQWLRGIHPAVAPGYHMNKEHWNTITLDGSLPDDEVLSLVDESYDLVVQGLPKPKRLALQARLQPDRRPD